MNPNTITTASTANPSVAAPANALSSRALYEEVAELLRQRIFRHELAPGDWIDELKLAQEYGISRTPLREALKVLAAEGLITMKVRRGAYVTEVSKQDIEQIFHLLALLEGDACATAATKLTDSQLQALESWHLELETAATQDREKFFMLNEQFHFHILEICNNQWLTQMVQDLRKVMKLYRHDSLLKQGRVAESMEEHKRIMQALRARDKTAAQLAMKQHIESGYIAASVHT